MTGVGLLHPLSLSLPPGWGGDGTSDPRTVVSPSPPGGRGRGSGGRPQ